LLDSRRPGEGSEYAPRSLRRHCEERSDEAVHLALAALWIASLALAMTVWRHDGSASITVTSGQSVFHREAFFA
jgi:hypothetical protein